MLSENFKINVAISQHSKVCRSNLLPQPSENTEGIILHILAHSKYHCIRNNPRWNRRELLLDSLLSAYRRYLGSLSFSHNPQEVSLHHGLLCRPSLSMQPHVWDIFNFLKESWHSFICRTLRAPFFFFNLINCDNVLIRVEPLVYFNSNILEIIISPRFGVPLVMGISFQM